MSRVGLIPSAWIMRYISQEYIKFILLNSLKMVKSGKLYGSQKIIITLKIVRIWLKIHKADCFYKILLGLQDKKYAVVNRGSGGNFYSAPNQNIK